MDAQDPDLFAAYNEEIGSSKVNLPATCKPLVRVTNSAKVGKSATIPVLEPEGSKECPYDHDDASVYAVPGRERDHRV
jgi:hypothetical protein